MAGICVEEDPNNNNNNNEKAYSLRPRTSGVKRGDDEDDDDVVGKEPKPRRSGRKRLKPSAPLSKYRRKTANARERSRMREINEAFDSLRRAVPGGGEPEKLTKITTLKLAMKYIAALSQALNGEQPQPLQQPPPPPPQLLQQPCPEELPSFPVLLPLTPPGSEKSSEEVDSARCLELADLRDHCLTPTDFNNFEPTIDFDDFFIT